MAISKIGSDALAAGAPSRSQLPAGTVLQVVSTTKTDTWSTSSTSDVAISGLSASITPTSATSKILVVAQIGASASFNNDYAAFYSLYRGGSVLSGARGNSNGTRKICTFANRSYNFYGFSAVSTQYLDSPASTSSLTYQVYAAMENGAGSIFVNTSGWSTDSPAVPLTISTITVMEIAA